MSVCYLIGAGSFTLRELYPKDGDFVIAADDGYTALHAAGITPDLLVGDFDSLSEIPGDIPVKAFPPEKDQTDMAIALEEGMARGYRTFRFYGANGGREDHTFANLQLLCGAARQGCDVQNAVPELRRVCRDERNAAYIRTQEREDRFGVLPREQSRWRNASGA